MSAPSQASVVSAVFVTRFAAELHALARELDHFQDVFGAALAGPASAAIVSEGQRLDEFVQRLKALASVADKIAFERGDEPAATARLVAGLTLEGLARRLSGGATLAPDFGHPDVGHDVEMF